MVFHLSACGESLLLRRRLTAGIDPSLRLELASSYAYTISHNSCIQRRRNQFSGLHLNKSIFGFAVLRLRSRSEGGT